MIQCPICMKAFASARYLTSHLHQSECCIALPNLGTVPTQHSTLVESSNNSSTSAVENPANNHIVHRPIAVNAFGDIVLDDDNTFGDIVLDEGSENSNHLPTSNEAATDILTSPPDSSIHADSGIPVLAESPNPISYIHQQESFNVPAAPDDKLIPILKIVTAVRASGAPLNLVDTIVKIIKDEWQVGRLDISNLLTHRTAMRRISKMFPSLPAPVSVTTTHERTPDELSSGAERPSLTFPKFSFLGQLQDLLDDHVFSDLQNLVLDPFNRWEYYQKDSCPHSSDEIQDGNWFQGIVQTVKANPSPPGIQDFVFGIQGYVDKTGTDAYQRTAVEPFVFTLTLFTNQIRNSDTYWRVLALLPSSLSQKQRKQHVFGASVRNYHTALKHAFDEFIQLQKHPPIVRLRLGDQFQNVRARLYWVNTIADGLANENLTGRIQNRNCSPRLSRGCHCPQHLSAESNLSCRFLRQDAIERLTVAALGPSPEDTQWDNYLNSLGSTQAKKAAASSLKTRMKMAQAILKNVFGQHLVDLVWFHVDQGPNPRGCFGSTPVDPMHAFEEGIVPNIMSVILDPLPESSKTSLDALAMQIVACNRWDPDYPRLNFSGGFSSLTLLTADEKVGKMLLLWIIMQTPLGMKIIEKRCDPSFDEQRMTVAGRFTVNRPKVDHSDALESDESDKDTTTNSQYYTGSPAQLELVQQCLQDHGLHFVTGWLQEMLPYHQEVLGKTIYKICCSKGKANKHILNPEPHLDRYAVLGDVPHLYYQEQPMHPILSEALPLELDKNEAAYSIDCTGKELQSLLEMMLAFHACYKYSQEIHRSKFDQNIRLMMSMIKQRINRGSQTKNWMISKFHELLHMTTDTWNFGSSSNIDAGKGEHGLQRWAKLPSRTVRTRSANHYYHDMAKRIYENRLLELATATLIPRQSLTSINVGISGQDAATAEIPGGNPTERVADISGNILITLSCPLTTLEAEGPSVLQSDLAVFIRRKSNLVFPITIFQEAQYVVGSDLPVTIRGTPNYRNSGPWHDCVLVKYDINNRIKKYPFQIYGFFVDESGNEQKLAVGKMGMQKTGKSKLYNEWTYEPHYRIVEMETISQVVFAVTIPTSCCRQGGGPTAHRMLVMKDRIREWPAIFNEANWDENNRTERNNRKRKARK